MSTALVALPAAAHDADLIYARIERKAPGEPIAETLTMTAETLELLAPVDADGDRQLTQSDLEARKAAIAAGVWGSTPLFAAGQRCELAGHSAKLREAVVELIASFTCARGSLTQRYEVLSVLPANYRVVVSSVLEGKLDHEIVEGNRQLAILEEDRAPSRGLVGWVKLGVLHIFTGFDHLAFLLAVLLVGGSFRRLLGMVTAFTVAHSLTLAAAALGLVPLAAGAQRWVEVAIALSIMWVALENLVLQTHRHRAALTFAFGLVHGFGFASVLADYGLGDELLSGLFGFNLGVELGQAAIVGVLFPLVLWGYRHPPVGNQAKRWLSGAVLALGGFLLVARIY